jgi:competence protein ComEC
MRRLLPIILIIVAACGAFYAWHRLRAHDQLAPQGPVLAVTFLDAATGGGIVLQTPEDEIAVIDPGPEATADDLTKYLKDQGTDRVTLVVSNPSPERAGAVGKLLESFKLKRIIRGPMDSGSGAWSQALAQARSLGTPELILSAGDSIAISGKVRFEVLSPPRRLIKNISAESLANSLVGRVAFGSVKLLLPSDADVQTEGHLIRSGTDLTSDILAVGRRGRPDATSLEFISLVRPKYFVVSTGGRFGQPSGSVRSRIDARNTGAEVYRTDRQGRIALITDGRTIAVEAERGGRE